MLACRMLQQAGKAEAGRQGWKEEEMQAPHISLMISQVTLAVLACYMDSSLSKQPYLKLARQSLARRASRVRTPFGLHPREQPRVLPADPLRRLGDG